MSMLSHSPTLIPIPRQPSPLSFSSLSAHEPPSPPTSTSSRQFPNSELDHSYATSDGYSTSMAGPSHRSAMSPPLPLRTSTSSIATLERSIADSPRSTPPRLGSDAARGTGPTLPLDLLPDSLLLRSTFAALEHSASTLKRLSKSVLASTTSYLALLQQLEAVEDELFGDLGELGRWLEGGYGINDGQVWDGAGIRKVRKDARAKEKAEIEVMVQQAVRSVKVDLKRNGLAGAGAQGKFEQAAKAYYQQTSSYLAPSVGSSSSSNHHTPHHHASQSSPIDTAPSHKDSAQAVRSAQFDLMRYSHHSSLLYAVPPTSVGCLDLLVSLYGWVGGLLGEMPESRTAGDIKLVGSERDDDRQKHCSVPRQMKAELSTSLARLSDTRSSLLSAWAIRDQQTIALEEDAAGKQADLEGSTVSTKVAEIASTPISSAGIEHKKPRKMHKLHRSVGGRLRDLLSSSSSSHHLSTSASGSNGTPTGDRKARASFDGGFVRPDTSRLAPALRTIPSSGSFKQSISTAKLDSTSNHTAPTASSGTPSSRPPMSNRHSMHSSRSQDYVSPFLAAETAVQSSDVFTSSVDMRARMKSLPVPTRPVLKVGGVGGLGAGGDEDEQREGAGRKKEGVLWGIGAWEGLSKGPSRNKWESFWVVLDRSSIYEYRDNGLGKPEGAHAVIDLKFASVREGRGTDRRFVFEIVTPTQGRRLYQATSELEMKTWMYAICNAIESCINGTSSVRTFDTSKLRLGAGSLDDHALPTKQLFATGGAPTPRMNGLALPISSHPATPGNRRSMPPPARGPFGDSPSFPSSAQTAVPNSGVGGANGNLEKRHRKPSFKKVFRQSAEIANERWSNVMSGRNNSGLDLPRPSFLGPQSRSNSRTYQSSETTDNQWTAGKDSGGEKTSNEAEVSQVDLTRSGRSQPNGAHNATKSWFHEDLDSEIEKKVLEMAGLGLGSSPRSYASGQKTDSESGSVARRVRSDGPTRSAGMALLQSDKEGERVDIARTRSADGAQVLGSEGREEWRGQPDMRMLRKVADLEENKRCADCGNGMKSSRWATLSLREVPMVMFLCIRCIGVHRSLGTHISKPRSVDMDIWSPESIVLARQWGNKRGNEVWEALKPGDMIAEDQAITEYIKAKYVEGRWLSAEDRASFGLAPQ